MLTFPTGHEKTVSQRSDDVGAAMTDHQSLIVFDAARALAAFIVLISHLRAFVFQDAGASGHLAVPWKIFYFATSLGHQAVIVFFVISGYLISKTIMDAEARKTWSWLRYAIKRESRLWMVLLPALVLTAVFDAIGRHFSDGALYSGALNAINHSTPITTLSFAFSTLLGNAFFLQTLFVPTYGSNTPLWSLANEFWYYVLFPVIYFAVRPGYRGRVRVGLLALGICLAVTILRPVVALGAVWLMGYLGVLVQPVIMKLSERIRQWIFIGALAAFGIALLASKTILINEYISDLVLGSVFTIVIAFSAKVRIPTFVSRLAALFASFSYTLYVVHFPLLACVVSLTTRNERYLPSISALVVYALLLVVAFAFAFVFSLFFERQTFRLQRRILNLPWVVVAAATIERRLRISQLETPR